MGEVEPYRERMIIPQEMSSAEVTIPGVQLYHYITDDQLLTLGDMRKEPVMEICLAAVGVFGGTLLPSIEALSRFNASENPMGIIGLITVILTVVSLGVVVVTGFLWKQRLKSHMGLVETIQSRKRVMVTANEP